MRGATPPTAGDSQLRRGFNSRTPCGVRHFSITFVVYLQCVSIHAPRAGCDLLSDGGDGCLDSFNSRTPCGVRLAAAMTIVEHGKFQFTHPVRGATKFGISCVTSTVMFQFTHPVRGATMMLILGTICFWSFNSRTPCGVRPDNCS